MTARYRIVLHGTPCGGTRFTSQALRAAGVDVGHERPGADGIACGWLLWSHLGGRRVQLADMRFEHTWRIYRDPIDVLETLPAYAQNPRSVRKPWDHPADGIAALRRWVHTHERIPADTPTLRIGSPRFGEDWARLCRTLGVPVVALDGVKPHRKDRRWPRTSWPELHRIDAEYAARAKRLVSELA